MSDTKTRFCARCGMASVINESHQHDLAVALASDTTSALVELAAEWRVAVPRGQFGGANYYKLIIELAQKAVGDE